MTLLPEAYAQLESFAAVWALPTTAERAAARSTSTAAERQAFYDAVSLQAAAILDELDTHSLDALTDQEKRLLDMVMAFGHVALAVEIQGPDEARHRVWRDRMVITRASADMPA